MQPTVVAERTDWLRTLPLPLPTWASELQPVYLMSEPS